jgi:hypothetical protein
MEDGGWRIWRVRGGGRARSQEGSVTHTNSEYIKEMMCTYVTHMYLQYDPPGEMIATRINPLNYILERGGNRCGI